MPRLFQLRSFLALTRGDHDLALNEAEAMVALDPNGDESHVALGRMYFYTGQYERAIESLSAAERINPDGRASYSAYLAFSHQALGMTDSAVAILETMAERKPDFSPTPAYLAIIYQLAGREAEARQQAALLVPNAPDITIRAIEYLFMPMQDQSLARRFVEAGRRAGIPG
jgi:tetratricopeptide (TPR) repeat protein